MAAISAAHCFFFEHIPTFLFFETSGVAIVLPAVVPRQSPRVGHGRFGVEEARMISMTAPPNPQFLRLGALPSCGLDLEGLLKDSPSSIYFSLN